MGTITFDPAQIASNVTDIGSNSDLVAANDTEIASNSDLVAANDTEIASNSDLISDNDGDITSNYTVGSDASAGVSGAVVDAAAAVVTADAASDDVSTVEADDRYASSIYSKPASGSFVITQIDVDVDSKIYLSHSDVAAS